MASYEAIRYEFEKMGKKVIRIIGLNDISLTTNIKAMIDNIDNMFDTDSFSQSAITLQPGGEVYIKFKVPQILDSMVVKTDGDATVWNNIQLDIKYVDGTQETKSFTFVPNVGAILSMGTLKRVDKITITNTGTSELSFHISEVIMYTIPKLVVDLASGDIEIGAVEIKDADTDQRAHVNSDGTIWFAPYDTNGTRINPATEDTLQSVYDILANLPQNNKAHADYAKLWNAESVSDGDVSSELDVSGYRYFGVYVEVSDSVTVVIQVYNGFRWIDYDTFSFSSAGNATHEYHGMPYISLRALAKNPASGATVTVEVTEKT